MKPKHFLTFFDFAPPATTAIKSPNIGVGSFTSIGDGDGN